jgi:hypothetical protein
MISILKHYSLSYHFVLPMYCRSFAKFYFDPKLFPFDGNFKNSKTTWSVLKQQIFRKAAENGFHLICNGGPSPTIRVVQCARHRKVSHSKQKSPKSPMDYRQSSMRSDRRTCSRGPEGKTMARRKPSYRSNSSAFLCPIRICFGVDISGFYLRGGTGCKQHRFHPRLRTDIVQLDRREMSSEELKSFHCARQAGLSCQGTAILASKKSQVFVKYSQVRYYTQQIQYAEYSLGLFPKVEISTAGKLLQKLKSERHDHIVLSHNGSLESNPGMQSSSFAPSTSGICPPDFLATLSVGENNLMNDFVTKHR